MKLMPLTIAMKIIVKLVVEVSMILILKEDRQLCVSKNAMKMQKMITNLNYIGILPSNLFKINRVIMLIVKKWIYLLPQK